MWSVWLVFCDCSFHSVCPRMDEGKRLVEASWWQWVKLGLALVDRSCCFKLPSPVWLFVTPWTAACQASLSFTISQNLLKLMSIESVMPSKHLILCCPLLFLPSILSIIRVFSNESVLRIRWPKYQSFSFSFSISPSNVYSGLISFRIDWFNLAVQETLKSSPTPQSQSINSSMRSLLYGPTLLKTQF